MADEWIRQIVERIARQQIKAGYPETPWHTAAAEHLQKQWVLAVVAIERAVKEFNALLPAGENALQCHRNQQTGDVAVSRGSRVLTIGYAVNPPAIYSYREGRFANARSKEITLAVYGGGLNYLDTAGGEMLAVQVAERFLAPFFADVFAPTKE